jgi:centrosomal protein CEP104
MPVKLPFTVVCCTGADDGFPATDLEVHGPSVKGWRAGRFCAWPQEIILALEEPARLRKVQVLSHQYMISSKLDIFVGTHPQKFTRLGHVSLSTNHQTSYKARELKSIHIDSVARFLKIVVHECHLNIHNWYNQVGIVAVNLIGDGNEQHVGATKTQGPYQSNVMRLGTGILHGEDEFSVSGDAVTHGGNMSIAMASGKIDYLGNYTTMRDGGGGDPNSALGGATLGMINGIADIDPEHDLAFDVYLDAETGAMIRQLVRLKKECVAEEKYEKAHELKAVIDGLLQAGEELAKLELIKQRAVDAEDFETAAMVRTQIAIFREKVYTVLGVSDAAEKGRIHHAELAPPSSPAIQHAVSQHQLPRTPPLPQIGSSTATMSTSTTNRRGSLVVTGRSTSEAPRTLSSRPAVKLPSAATTSLSTVQMGTASSEGGFNDAQTFVGCGVLLLSLSAAGAMSIVRRFLRCDCHVC